MPKYITPLIIFFISLIAVFTLINTPQDKNIISLSPVVNIRKIIPVISLTPTEIPLPTPPSSYTIPLRAHVFQTFNNCGPASLSMLLSYFDLNVSQKEIGDKLRPFQIASGANDDKSVTLEELAKEGESRGFVPYHRPNGNLDKLKYFISQGFPILVRTWTAPGEDIGHYRVIRGYDDVMEEIIQDDSLQNKNLRFSYDYFLDIWQAFNFEYLVLVPQDRKIDAEKILKEETDATIAWSNAVDSALSQLSQNPDDIFARFNLSVAHYHTGDYRQAVNEFESIEKSLPARMLWYQIEPIQSYFELEEYDRVFELTDKILSNHNRAFSELYILRGQIYKRLGQEDIASQEFEKALYYNKNIQIPSA